MMLTEYDEVETMNLFKEEYRAEGKNEGKIEGRIEGRIEGKQKMARNMALMGVSTAEIAKVAEESVDLIQEWLK